VSFESPSVLAPGYKLDRYELLCPIAEGGMASVWIARQTGKHGFQKLVAIKTILPKYAADERFQQMFVDEARIASRIEHANVTQILDVGEQHEITYLVMEYVDGDALSKLNRAARKNGGGIPHGIVLRIMADVCGGLHAAHELQGDDRQPLGVVHRDVSPQNVLVSTRGVAKLIDFGIAKARDRLAGDTNAETLKGKVQYMAPEQALGRQVDRRADVWAVGAVLHHLLGGKPPFEAENEIQTLFVLSSGRPPPPLRGDVHPAVAVVVRRALSHSPAARFATAAEMQQALEDAIVKAGLSTSQATIASYLADRMGDRADKRKEAIALGLKAAEDREKVAAVMRSNTELPNTGTSSTGVSGVSSASVVRADATSPSLTSGKTIGSAAVSILPDAPRRGTRFAIVGGVLGAAVAVLGILALVSGRATSSRAAASHAAAVMVAPPPPLATAAPPPVIPDPVPIPTADVESLPSASASSSAMAPTPTPTTPAAHWPTRTATPPSVPPTPLPTAAAKPTTPSVPTRVNDGF
jgi:eukaryotic-like serine/threonine-protein kinase